MSDKADIITEKDDKAGSTEKVSEQVLDYQPEAVAHLDIIKKQHAWDPNMPQDVLEDVEHVLEGSDFKAQVDIADELLNNSPYPEVRSAVPNTDDGGLANTIRAWVLGMLFATLGSGLNTIFSMRAPYIIISSYVAQVVAFPFGVAWARFVPAWKFSFFGIPCNLNPGPFSKKEHAIIVIMANATFGGGAAYATDVILAQRAFYKQRFGWGFELLMCLSTQMLGFGVAGFFHKFLVTPGAMIWPANLINTTLFSALHDTTRPDPAKTSGWKMDKYRLFVITMVGSFCWYWLPGYIAPFLSVFAWVTFIRPNNAVINQVFGGLTGLSVIPLTFDWTQISGFNFSPLIAPWHAMGNTLIGMVIFFWIVTPAIHYSNLFYSKYLPISDSSSYDNTATSYNVSRILTPQGTFDLHEYQTYSPLFLSTTFMLSYGLSFASIIAVLVHTALFHGKGLVARFRMLGNDEEDVHSRMMQKYKQVPWWWYTSVALVMLGVSLGVTQGYPTDLSWWAFFLSLIICMIFFVPVGLIQATTNIGIGLNVITEFIVGYVQPGRPMAMMLFKTYGYITMNQGLGFAQDMKLGQYMKIPPRVTFMAQMISCFWCSIVQIAVLNWALGAIPDVCDRNQPSHYSCPNGRVFFQASVIWGLIGPQRIFSPGSIYNGMLYFFIPGVLLPIIIYLAARRFPHSPARYLSAPIIFGGSGLIPPATPLNYLSWGIVGFIFNKWIRNRWRGWWMQYNYCLSAGLDVGLALCTILIFCALSLTQISFPSWWGTDVAENTMDAMGTAVQVILEPGQTFGPATW